MGRQYFRKANPAGTDQDVQWIEMNGREFYQFIMSPEGQGRYFVDLEDYIIEASKSQYEEWRREKDHSDYLAEHGADVPILSLYSEAINENGNGEDVVADHEVNVEESAFRSIRLKALRLALSQLDPASYLLIRSLYLEVPRKTERALAKELGVSQNAVNKQKKKVFRHLKFLVVKFEKSSQ